MLRKTGQARNRQRFIPFNGGVLLMPRRGYTVPPVSGSSVPDFCKVFGTLYSIWAQEHGFGEDVKVIFEPVPPGEKPREGAYVIRPTHDVRGEDHGMPPR
uniref:Uncharacterized protein n=1 Tax=virus sp. ctJLD79 TaxID=2827987 RepID=A0A8S5RF59_9VIRU|nr:MAG TPA: hypothetical protein [virus sp. ctJLD79]